MNLSELLKEKKNKKSRTTSENNNRAGEVGKHKKCKTAEELVAGKSTRSYSKWTAMKRRVSLVEARIDLGAEFVQCFHV